MVKVKLFHHATLTVTDLEATKGFYEGLLGLQPIERPNVPVPGAWYGCGQQQLHIVVVAESPPSARSLNPLERGREGWHVAFAVNDIEAMKNKLQDTGIPFVEGIPELKQIFVEDPGSNLIELNEGF